MLGSERQRQAAIRNLQACEDFVTDMADGWRLVKSDPDVARCLQWTCQAMDDQRLASTAPLREVRVTKAGSSREVTVSGENPHLKPRSVQGYWRPFQIAFILASLPATVNPSHPKRDLVDIVWMPTGGGKTEAYLGLAAFTMLWNRFRQVASDERLKPSVDVLMRYTLRLLTAQQVQRASALICALEVLRMRIPAELGDSPFRIGAYLGGAATPNTRADAIKLCDELNKGGRSNRTESGFLLTRCPWCGTQMGVVDGTLVGYVKESLNSGAVRVKAVCPAEDCPFSQSNTSAKKTGLPVLEVDDDIYEQPPSFLVGTIDKFAQLSWKEQARRLFGLKVQDSAVHRHAPAPSLFIQDELHLISGPLGSLNALYEIALQELCEFDGGRRPRIIAATATTRNFEKQILRLYGRDKARLVPPPALDIDDSFFAKLDDSKPGKVFVGICAPGFGRNVQGQLRTIAALVHAGGTLDVVGAEPDPWWTNLAFFSSRRSLGLLLSACQTGLETATFTVSRRSGLPTGKLTDRGTRSARRSLSQIKELTATSGDNVTQLLTQLERAKDSKGCVDICFATSMIEVGVDVPRLGLMTVMGQPKSYSQYIQVTGRVGRTHAAPGLVMVVLSPNNVRDRSHYETFTASHQRLYASVEPVSITPFTPQALERGLAGALTAVLRATNNVQDPSELLEEPALHASLTAWQLRASMVGGERAATSFEEERARLQILAQAAKTKSSNSYLEWGDSHSNGSQALILPLGGNSSYSTEAHWRVPLSMRSVDAEAGVSIQKGIGFSVRPSGRPAGEEEADDF